MILYRTSFTIFTPLYQCTLRFLHTASAMAQIMNSLNIAFPGTTLRTFGSLSLKVTLKELQDVRTCRFDRTAKREKVLLHLISQLLRKAAIPKYYA